MSDKTEQVDKNNSRDFSGDAVRRFLLGRLDATERTTFEERLFTDDGLEARVRLVEFELADDYVLARLSAADRTAFEERFLLTAGRKRTLGVSTALRNRFASASNAAIAEREGAKASIAERLRLLFGLNQRSWRIAFGIVISVVLVASVWLVVKQPRIKESIKASIFNRRGPAPAPSAPRLTEHSTNTSSVPGHQTTPSPMPPHEPTASPAIVSIVLFPGAARDGDELPRIVVPKGEYDIVRLRLALKRNQARTCRAEVLTIDGQSVFSTQSLRPTNADASNADFDIPATMLKTGDYQVKLSRADGGSKRSFASYYFRVQ